LAGNTLANKTFPKEQRKLTHKE